MNEEEKVDSVIVSIMQLRIQEVVKIFIIVTPYFTWFDRH